MIKNNDVNNINEINVKERKWWSCRYDRTFKDIFCGEDNKEMLTPLLSCLFGYPVVIEKIFFNEIPNVNINDRRKVVDLFVKANGRYILLELNNCTPDYVHFRNFISFASTIVQKTKKGEMYDKKIEHILINLNYGEKDKPYFFDEYMLTSKMTGLDYLENIKVWNYNMDRIKWEWYNGVRSKVERYQYLVMLDCEEDEIDDFTKGDSFMEEFNKRIKKLNSDSEFQAFMTVEEENEMFYNTDISIARSEGKEEGETNFIKRMLSNGASIDDISRMSGMSLEEIKSLIKE